eukprot:119673_1
MARERVGHTTIDPTILDPTVVSAFVPVLREIYCFHSTGGTIVTAIRGKIGKGGCDSNYNKKYELLMLIQDIKQNHRTFTSTRLGTSAGVEKAKSRKDEVVDMMSDAYARMCAIPGLLNPSLKAAFEQPEERSWIDSDPEQEPWTQVQVELIMGLHLLDHIDTKHGQEAIADFKTTAQLNGVGPPEADIDHLLDQIKAQTITWYGHKYGSRSAKSGYYSELNLFDDPSDYQYHEDIHSAHSLPFDDRSHYQPLVISEYHDVSESGSPLLIGGVVGASAVVVIMLIFCLGLAFGMVIYWGYTQNRKKREFEVKSKKVEMRWIDENRNEV